MAQQENQESHKENWKIILSSHPRIPFSKNLIKRIESFGFLDVASSCISWIS